MKANKDKGTNFGGESFTVTLSKQSPQPFARKGEILVTKFGKKRYSIVTKDSSDKDNIWDDEFGNSFQSTISLRMLSKWLIIRKIQIIFYHLKQKYGI